MSDPRRFDPSIDDDGVIFMMPNALGAYTTYTEWQMVQRQLTEALKPRVCRWSYETGVTGCHHLVTAISGDPFCPKCGGNIEVV